MEADTVPMALSLLLIGVSGIATAVAGVMLPAGHRLESLIGLVAGAGAGLAMVAAGALAEVANEAGWFLVSTVVGLTATLGVLVALVRRQERPSTGDPDSVRHGKA